MNKYFAEIEKNYPKNGSIYLIEEKGDKTKMSPTVAYIVAKNATEGYCDIYNSKTKQLIMAKQIYVTKKGYYINFKGKRYYLDDFKRGENK